MLYRVAFQERVDGQGRPSEDPTGYVAIDLADGVVTDCTFVERIEPDALHGQDSMEEDDSFKSIAMEVWEYEVADGRDQEFIDALKNSKVVVEFETLEDVDMIEPGTAGP